MCYNSYDLPVVFGNKSQYYFKTYISMKVIKLPIYKVFLGGINL